MLNFNDLNKKGKKKQITNKHITDTRPKKRKRTKKSNNNSNKKFIVDNSNTFLSTQISANYEGKVDGIIAYIKTLPKDIQMLINNSNLKKTTVRQGFSMYVLDNGVTIKVKDEKIGKKNYLRVQITKGRKELFNNIIR